MIKNITFIIHNPSIPLLYSIFSFSFSLSSILLFDLFHSHLFIFYSTYSFSPTLPPFGLFFLPIHFLFNFGRIWSKTQIIVQSIVIRPLQEKEIRVDSSLPTNSYPNSESIIFLFLFILAPFLVLPHPFSLSHFVFLNMFLFIFL